MYAWLNPSFSIQGQKRAKSGAPRKVNKKVKKELSPLPTTEDRTWGQLMGMTRYLKEVLKLEPSRRLMMVLDDSHVIISLVDALACFPTLLRDKLQRLASAHGLPAMGTMEMLRNRIFSHQVGIGVLN